MAARRSSPMASITLKAGASEAPRPDRSDWSRIARRSARQSLRRGSAPSRAGPGRTEARAPLAPRGHRPGRPAVSPSRSASSVLKRNGHLYEGARLAGANELEAHVFGSSADRSAG